MSDTADPVFVVTFEIVAARRSTSVRGVDYFDGVDVALRTTDGATLAFGVRTAGFMAGDPGARALGWSGSHRPVRTDVELDAVRYWDFNRLLWIGPEPRPCLVWSNAEGLSTASVDRLVRSERAAVFLAGRDGAGLPTLDEVESARH